MILCMHLLSRLLVRRIVSLWHDRIPFKHTLNSVLTLAFALFNTSASIKKMVDRGLQANIGAHGEQPLGFNYHAEMLFALAGGLTNYEVRSKSRYLRALFIIFRIRSYVQRHVQGHSASASSSLLGLFHLANWPTSWSTPLNPTSSKI